MCRYANYADKVQLTDPVFLAGMNVHLSPAYVQILSYNDEALGK